VFVLDFEKIHFVKKIIFSLKMKIYSKVAFPKSIFSKYKELKCKSFKSSKNDFYDSKQTQIALDFFENLYKKKSRFFYLKIYFF